MIFNSPWSSYSICEFDNTLEHFIDEDESSLSWSGDDICCENVNSPGSSSTGANQIVIKSVKAMIVLEQLIKFSFM